MYVLNGNFNSYPIAQNTFFNNEFLYTDSTDKVPSWTITRGDGVALLLNGSGNPYGPIVQQAFGFQGLSAISIKQSINLNAGHYTLTFKTLRRNGSNTAHTLNVGISNEAYTVLTTKSHNGFETTPSSQRINLNAADNSNDTSKWSNELSLKSYTFIVFTEGNYILKFDTSGTGEPADSTIFLTDIRITKTPVITNITDYTSNSFNINFTTTTSPDNEFSYKYSLDGGINFKTQTFPSSPITVSGIRPNTIYRVVIKYSSSAGDSSISNMVPAIIRKPSDPTNSVSSTPPPVITSITNDGTSFSVNYTQESITGSISTTYYSLDGGFTFNQTSGVNPFPITSGIKKNMVYKVVMKHTISAGDSAISNMVPAIIQVPIVPVNSGTSTFPPPVITSITNDGTSFIVNFTQDSITGSPVINYFYSLDGGFTFNQTNGSNPFLITSGIQKNMVYKVVMKHRINDNADSAISNMVPAVLS